MTRGSLGLSRTSGYTFASQNDVIRENVFRIDLSPIHFDEL